MEEVTEEVKLVGDLVGTGVGLSGLAVDDPALGHGVQVVEPVLGPLDANLGRGGDGHEAESDQKGLHGLRRGNPRQFPIS